MTKKQPHDDHRFSSSNFGGNIFPIILLHLSLLFSTCFIATLSIFYFLFLALESSCALVGLSFVTFFPSITSSASVNTVIDHAYCEAPSVENFFIRRLNILIFSGFESLLVDNFVMSRLNTSIFSGFERLLVENLFIRRFKTSIISGFESLFFAVITRSPKRAPQDVVRYLSDDSLLFPKSCWS